MTWATAHRIQQVWLTPRPMLTYRWAGTKSQAQFCCATSSLLDEEEEVGATEIGFWEEEVGAMEIGLWVLGGGLRLGFV